jgi:hypothetical protein
MQTVGARMAGAREGQRRAAAFPSEVRDGTGRRAGPCGPCTEAWRQGRAYGQGWAGISAAHLIEEPHCRRCGALATVTDHIVPVRDGGGRERSNLQSLCDRCHQLKTIAESLARSLSGRSSEEPTRPVL